MEETAETRLRDFATAMQLKSEEMIPPGYKTDDAEQFINDIHEVLAKLTVLERGHGQ
jgi:hypothetical protein